MQHAASLACRVTITYLRLTVLVAAAVHAVTSTVILGSIQRHLLLLAGPLALASLSAGIRTAPGRSERECRKRCLAEPRERGPTTSPHDLRPKLGIDE